MIRLQGVSKTYGNGTRALKSVDLTVRDGEFVFLTGQSGSGKSTLLKLLTGEERPTSGLLSVNGYDMGLLRPWQVPYVRRTLGVVFQDYRLVADRTVRENLELACMAVNMGRAMRGRAEYAAELCGVADKLDAPVRSLSGGQQQRTCIARAVVNMPQAVLADEPTGNLDPDSSAGVMELLDRINGLGMTVVVVSHDRASVDASPHRAVALESGRVVNDGTGYYLSRWDELELRKAGLF